MPNGVVAAILPRASSRGVGLPTMRNCAGSFSVTCCGTGSAIAACASSPKVARWLPEVSTPCSTLMPAASTCHLCAAAVTSMARARAPSSRYCWNEWFSAVEPPVICMPKAGSLYASPAGASVARTLRQSASSSSASAIGSAVCTPWPNSSRFTATVTVLSGAMIRNACGGGALDLPPSCACACASGATPSASPPPARPVSFRKPRRLSVAMPPPCAAPSLPPWPPASASMPRIRMICSPVQASARAASLIAARMRW
ncbi:hypothetical protein D3C81_1368580 [compost metagenome]